MAEKTAQTRAREWGDSPSPAAGAFIAIYRNIASLQRSAKKYGAALERKRKAELANIEYLAAAILEYHASTDSEKTEAEHATEMARKAFQRKNPMAAPIKTQVVWRSSSEPVTSVRRIRPVRRSGRTRMAAPLHSSRVLKQKRNPKSESDPISVRELELWCDNTYSIYQMKMAVWKNLNKKVKAGKYNSTLAIKAFMHVADAGSHDYFKNSGSAGGTGKHAFTRAVREEVAKALRDEFQTENDVKSNPRRRVVKRKNPSAAVHKVRAARQRKLVRKARTTTSKAYHRGAAAAHAGAKRANPSGWRSELATLREKINDAREATDAEWARLDELKAIEDAEVRRKRRTSQKKRRMTMADVRAKSTGNYFDKGNSKFFGPEKFYGPYVGAGGVYFVQHNKAGWKIKRQLDDGSIRAVSYDGRGGEFIRKHAQSLAKGT